MGKGKVGLGVERVRVNGKARCMGGRVRVGGQG